MKIVLFSTGLQLGGAETQVADLARGFLARGHDVTLISLTGATTIRLPDDARLRLIELRARKTPWSLAAAIIRLARHVHRLQPDVVHAHMIHANLVARVARLLAPMRVLVTSAHSRNEGGRVWMRLYRLTDGLTDLTTNVSDDAVAAFVAAGAVPAGRIVSMPNGIDTRRYHADTGEHGTTRATVGIAPTAPFIFAAGRLVDAKDYPTLLDAFSRLRDAIPDARLAIAGDGPLRAALQARSDYLGLGQRVTLLGRRDDVPALMRAADVHVMSSAWEGLPLVVGEAMASGLPVVSTDCGGVREMLGDDVASPGAIASDSANRLVPIGDAQALADALRTTLALPADARAVAGAANRARIDAHYSLDAVVTRWLAWYERLQPTPSNAS